MLLRIKHNPLLARTRGEHQEYNGSNNSNNNNNRKLEEQHTTRVQETMGISQSMGISLMIFTWETPSM